MEARKLEAIYELREAAQEYGRVLDQSGDGDDPAARDRRLSAMERLEESTARAIEACEYCGRPHTDEDPPKTSRKVIPGPFPKPEQD
jgi:hypothetical protein